MRHVRRSRDHAIDPPRKQFGDARSMIHGPHVHPSPAPVLVVD
jgi:hypothetical protein